MTQDRWLVSQFEEQRLHLRAVAYRMLGSLTEADDAVQETWIRVSKAGADNVDNLGGWLTTITARVCLNMLRARRSKAEESVDMGLPDPVVTPEGEMHPEQQAVLADSVGLALLVVLDTLSPPERLAFVLHDLFQLPYNEIGPILGRSSEAARQLASRARRRIEGAELPKSGADRHRQRQVVNAFFEAARGGDFDALLELLDDGVVLRADYGGRRPAEVIRGRQAVAQQSLRGGTLRADIHPAVINGSAGAIITVAGKPLTLMGFVVIDGRIVEIDAIVDPERVRRLAASILDSL